MTGSQLTAAARSWAGGIFPRSGLVRRLAVLTVVQSLGMGVFVTSGVIFFTRVIGLPPTQVGLGLSVAGICGLLGTVPIGKLADRFGPRLLLGVGYLALTALFMLYSAVRDLASFIVVASLISVAETSSSPLRMTLTRACLPDDEQVRAGAQLRGLFNVGFMLGAVLAGAALTIGTRPAFYAVISFTAAAQAACAAITWRLPVPAHVPAPRSGTTSQRSGLRDLRFVLLSLLCGVLELYEPVLLVAIPLWIITRTRVPASVNSALLVLDTALVFALQALASRGAETAVGAAKILRRSGFLLAGCCLLFALTRHAGPLVGIPLLLAGTVVLVLGEISQAAGSFGLSFRLAPAERQGEYQGVFALARGVPQTAGPVLVTALAVGLGLAGWAVLAAMFIGSGLACLPLTRSAEKALRTSDPQPRPTAAV